MISCRIVLNELPDDVLEQVLCIDEVDDNDRRWKLLGKTPTDESYLFIPRPGSKEWFIRWGHASDWQSVKASVMGRDDATLNWKNTSRAERLGIPVARFRLLGAPRVITGSFDTLLAREYLRDACSVNAFLIHNFENKLGIEDTLVALGDLLGMIHACGLQHGNFTLDNLLIQYGDPTRLAVTDWRRMQTVDPDDLMPFQEDLMLLANAMSYVGLGVSHVRTVIEAYGNRAPWSDNITDDIIRLATPQHSRN